MLDELIVPIH